MALPYYVEPEYWEEGYAVGDAKLVSGSTSAALTTSADSQRIHLTSSLISVQASPLAAAQRIQSVAAIVAAQISTSSVVFVTFRGAATISVAASLAASVNRIKDVSVAENYYVEENYWEAGYESTETCQLSTSSAATATFSNSATINCSASLAAAVNRIQRPSALIEISAIFAASARLKWETEPDTPETWTDVAAASGIWTDVPDASEIWTEVA